MAVYYTNGSMLRGCRYCLDKDMPFPTTHEEAVAAADKAAEQFWWNWRDEDSRWSEDFYLFPDKDTAQAAWHVEVATWEQQVFESRSSAQLIEPEEGT